MRNAGMNYFDKKVTYGVISFSNVNKEDFLSCYESKKNNLIKEVRKLLVATESNAFSKRKFVVTDESVAKIKGDLSYCKKEVCYKLKVKSLLSSQITESKRVEIKDTQEVIQNLKCVELIIKQAKRDIKIKIELSSYETIMSILESIVRELNEISIGIKASLVKEKVNQNTYFYIKLISNEGRDFKFKINVRGKENELLNTLFDVKNVSEATDVVYELCGKEHISKSHIVSMNKYIDINILSVGEASLINAVSTKVIISDVQKNIELYNDLVEYLIDNQNEKMVLKELRRFRGILKGLMYELSILGIEITASGKLICDSNKLKSSLIMDLQRVKRVLSKEGGLADRILYLLQTSSISLVKDSKSDKVKKAFIAKYYGGVKDKIMIDQPIYILGENGEL